MSHHDVRLTSRTGRLTLRAPVEADDEAMAALRSHPRTREYLRFLPEHCSVADARARRESRARDESILDFIAHASDGGAFVGTCTIYSIDPLNDSCWLGLLVDPAFHRGGYATEMLHALLRYVFEERSMHRVAFDTGIDNVAMRGWLENVAGAKHEFTWRECWKDGPGQWLDVVGYSILEREWRDTVKGNLERRLDAAAAKEGIITSGTEP
ncbi:hypothetical protein PLICRDRAFT_541879 [Plicaturopsis crispa FD-325 SS-3]|nr:hypothetical protein PLICRDRAFT_541879 [Plicaturopsis crispa FD-325 SS-3]